MKICSEQTDLYPAFRRMRIRHGDIGLEQRKNEATYFCTPRGAEILGWAGVDGIHYCRIPEFGEMIFAVSPMNTPECVRPIAKNFRDLLCLLLTCGDMAVPEQCPGWEREQYDAFLRDYPITEAQRSVLDKLRTKFALQPIEDVYGYVKALQAEFDPGAIPYTEDYYDIDMNPAAGRRETEETPAPWAVSFRGGFGNTDGTTGREIPVGRDFLWNGEFWTVPAIYLCEEGIVVDCLARVESAVMEAFLEKWQLNYGEEPGDDALAAQMQAENPLEADFDGTLSANGVKLRSAYGCGVSWVPALGDGNSREARAMVEHYGLDKTKIWCLHRRSYRFADGVETVPTTLSMYLVRRPRTCLGDPVLFSAVGDRVTLTHPVTGVQHLLCVKEMEQKELPAGIFQREDMEFPTHYTAVSCTLEPDLPCTEFMLRDTGAGDRPRPKRVSGDFGPEMMASIGIIGGADGPTMILSGGEDRGELHSFCSAPRFAPQKRVRLCPVFLVKTAEDICVALMGEDC
ncbi:MAG: sodium ion-translocating decarboxylase subunit beta [Clostridia bacterium]|nr:sodium ion-translocating decarboxylase subunit beta [Clostridia bacterium]